MKQKPEDIVGSHMSALTDERSSLIRRAQKAAAKGDWRAVAQAANDIVAVEGRLDGIAVCLQTLAAGAKAVVGGRR
jgi:hypothetical protein